MRVACNPEELSNLSVGDLISLLAGHSDEDAFTRALLECTCAVRSAVLAFRKDPARAVINALYVDGLPDKLRPLSISRLAKMYKHPLVALITERTSFKTDEVGTSEASQLRSAAD